jgi:hypothetical protein
MDHTGIQTPCVFSSLLASGCNGSVKKNRKNHQQRSQKNVLKLHERIKKAPVSQPSAGASRGVSSWGYDCGERARECEERVSRTRRCWDLAAAPGDRGGLMPANPTIRARPSTSWCTLARTTVHVDLGSAFRIFTCTFGRGSAPQKKFRLLPILDRAPTAPRSHFRLAISLFASALWLLSVTKVD